MKAWITLESETEGIVTAYVRGPSIIAAVVRLVVDFQKLGYHRATVRFEVKH